MKKVEEFKYKNPKSPTNCAHGLDIPTVPRQASNFVGLKNEGATSYCNTFLQVLYMNPYFRNILLSMPICTNNEEEFTSLFPNKSERNIFWNLQKLFSELKYGNIESTSIKSLTESFGWDNSSHLQQHDAQEFLRILFEILNKGVKGTPYNSLLTDLFEGILMHKIICQTCSTIKERKEEYFDLALSVKNLDGLEISLNEMISFEHLNHDNQYYCEYCAGKCDASKGIRVRSFPPVLTFALKRFEMDFNTLQIIKINSKFTFPLELRTNSFKELMTQKDDIYDLQAIIIHRGTANGGFYHAYIQDTLEEGNWDPKSAELYKNQEERCWSVKKDETNIFKEEEIPPKLKNTLTEESKENIEIGKPPTPNQKHWFDFSDTRITPIFLEQIEKQFGGTDQESAYILIYILRNFKYSGETKNQDDACFANTILKERIENRNKKEEIERVFYKEQEGFIEVIFQGSEYFHNIADIGKLVYLTEHPDSGFKIKVKYEDKLQTLVDQFMQEISPNHPGFGLHDIVIIEIRQKAEGDSCQIIRDLYSLEFSKSIRENGIRHWSKWVYLIGMTDQSKSIIEQIDPTMK